MDDRLQVENAELAVGHEDGEEQVVGAVPERGGNQPDQEGQGVVGVAVGIIGGEVEGGVAGDVAAVEAAERAEGISHLLL